MATVRIPRGTSRPVDRHRKKFWLSPIFSVLRKWTGFRLGRVPEFLSVIRRETAQSSPEAKWRLLWGILVAGLGVIMGRRVKRGVWRRRVRVCAKCPIYSGRPMRQCRPYPSSDLGCGCLIWAKALAKNPKGCWGRQYLGIGWG